MAFDSSRIVVADAAWIDPHAGVRSDFHRPERLVVLGGSLAVGALAGFSVAIILGALSAWEIALIAAPVLTLALYLASQTLREGFARNAYGCVTATALHGAALIAWPLGGLLTPLAPAAFWLAPALAVGSLIMFASCWTGRSRTVYRLAAQGALVAALAAHQGTLLLIGA